MPRSLVCRSPSVLHRLATLFLVSACGAPSITTQPVDLTVASGATASFTAAASGSPTVQWQQSVDHGATFTNLAGETTGTLSFAATPSKSGYEYRAVFTNGSGTATSNAATLTVTSGAPVVTTQPSDVSAAVGATASFTAASSNSPTIQWQQSVDHGATFTDLAGATAGTLSFTVTAGQGGSQYRAVFTNVAGTATSNAATLTLSAGGPPVITTQPADVSVASGSTATFTAAASGSPTVQWQRSTDHGATFSNLAGETAGTLTFATSPSQSGYEYRAVFTNGAGSATSNAATLTVTGGQPVVTTQPNDLSVAAGASASFTAAASGSATVQWQQSVDHGATFSNVPGATSVTLTFNTSAGQNGYQYRAVFTNLAGTATSSAATLTVTGAWWAAPRNLEAASAPYGVSPQVGIDSQGNVEVTWIESSHNYSWVTSVRYTASTGTWSTPAPLTVLTNFIVQNSLAMAMAPGGQAVAVWTQTPGAFGENPNAQSLWVASMDATGTWSSPTYVSGDLTTPQGLTLFPHFPTVAMDSNGNAFAVWEQGDAVSSTHTNLWGSRYTAGGSWSVAHAISTENQVVGVPHVGFDAAGNAFAVYLWQGLVAGSPANVPKVMRWVAASGTWSAAQEVASSNPQSQSTPNLSVGANGDALVTWYRNDGTFQRALVAHFKASTGTWDPEQYIDDGSSDVYDLTVGLDAQGRGWLVWTGNYSPFADLRVRPFSPSTGMGAVSTIPMTDPVGSRQKPRYPQLAFDAAGDAVVLVVASPYQTAVNADSISVALPLRCPQGGSWSSAPPLLAQDANPGQVVLSVNATGKAAGAWTTIGGTTHPGDWVYGAITQ